MKVIRAIVRGRVQGVGYRYFISKKARLLGMSGYVRNLPDGNVEVVFNSKGGNAEEEFKKYMAKGPILARIDDILFEDVKMVEQFEDFEIRY